MLKTTLVLGASTKADRYSNRAVRALSQKDHPVIAVGLREGSIGDHEIIIFTDAFAKASTLKQNLDTVTLYIGPARQPEYYDFIIALAPKRVIFNPGTENAELYSLLEKNNIDFEIACTLVLLATNQY